MNVAKNKEASMEARDILKDLVAINTIADKNNHEIMDYIEAFYDKIGVSVERRANEKTGKEVLIASYGEDPAIGFMGHTDTVDITDGWVTDPFVLTDKGDGNLYGLGSCDMKGGMACWMAAIANTDFKSLKKGFKCYHTYDEEIMFEGIHDLVDGGEKFPEHVIVAEPTDMVPSIGSKGLLEIIFTFRGVTTHSSTPIDGKNSNKNAVRFLNKMIDFEMSLREHRTEFFAIPYSTMNIGILKGGNAINKVPAETTIYLDFRIADSKYEYPKIRAFIDEAIAEFDASYEIINDIPSFISESDLVKVYEEKTGKKGEPFSGITEGSFYEGDKIIIGPGPMTMHQKNECVSIEQLKQTQQIYEEMIEMLCK